MIITSGSATSGSTSFLEPEPLPDFPEWVDDDSNDGTEEAFNQ